MKSISHFREITIVTSIDRLFPTLLKRLFKVFKSESIKRVLKITPGGFQIKG